MFRPKITTIKRTANNANRLTKSKLKRTALSADQNAVNHGTKKLRYIKYTRTCEKIINYRNMKMKEQRNANEGAKTNRKE